MSAPAIAGHGEAMELDDFEDFANSNPRHFQRADSPLKTQEDVDLDMDNWNIKNGAPRAPKAMQASQYATRQYKTPTSKLYNQNRSLYITAQEAWEADGRHSQSYWAPDAQLNNMDDYGERRRFDGPRRGRGRRDHYGGPRGGGGGRKRNFREYDEDDGYDRRNDDRRDRGPSWQKVRKHIIEIGDSPMRDAKEDVEQIASMVAKDWQNDYFREQITNTLVKMVIEQPMKIPCVAGIILNLNKNYNELVTDLLPRYTEQAQKAVDTGHWRALKLVLRFFACAHGLFEGTKLFDVLDELFNRAVDLQTASSDDAIGLEITKVILLTIPYILTAPNTDQEAMRKKAAEILDKTEVIASAPPAAEDLVNPYLSVEGEEAPEMLPVLRLLQVQLRNEQNKQWKLDFIAKFFEGSEANLIGGMDGDESFKRHDFPTIQVPATITPGAQPVFPELYFSLFADQDVETVPRTTNLASTVIRDALVDTINILDFNRGQTSRYLTELDNFWPRGTFAKRAIQFDRLREAGSGESTWKIEDMALDAIFSQMMKLPYPEHKAVYYHSIITEMCTMAPQSIAPSLGRSIRFLYGKLNVMDLELSYRFLDWFSHHLSNFDFRWKWAEWKGDADLTPLHCRKAFVLGLLDKEVRLSFAKRIRDSLPGEFAECIPTSRDNDIPEWKFKDESTPFHAEGKQLVECVRQKKPDEDIEPVLTSIMEQASQDTTYPQPQLIAIDAFVTTLTYVGSKSLSHALSFIERHKNRLFSFSQDPLLPPNDQGADPEVTASANRVQIVASVVAYWREVQTGVGVSLVDKMLNYGIVLPSSVIDWALGVSNPGSLRAGRALPEAWLYELVSNTLGKVTNRVNQIVAARGQEGVPKPQARQLEETLMAEHASMRNLFKMVDDVLVGVAEGSNDEMIEEGMGEVVGDAPDEREISQRPQLALLKMWGQKWLRVFRRKAAAEEKKIKEGMGRWPEPVDPATVKANGHGEQVDDMDTAEADGV